MYLITKKIRQKHIQFAAHISLDKKLKDQNGAVILPFSLFYTIKALNGKLTVYRRFFSASIYRTGKALIRFPSQSQRLMKFPTRMKAYLELFRRTRIQYTRID